MTQDITWKDYFLDNDRYADIINGIGCEGRQVVTKDDLQENTCMVSVKTADLNR